MDETRELPPTPPGDREDRFEPHRMRTIADMRRTRDDRLVAGVCTGVGRHLGVDPVLVRVVVVVLTFVGLAGIILYAAAWLLVPEDGQARSVVGRWFGLDENEDRVRTVGLVGAGVLAVVAVLGDGGWGWGDDAAFWTVFWVGVPVAILYWLFAVLPRRRREAGTPTSTASTPAAPPADPTDPDPTAPVVATGPAPSRPPRAPYPWTLTVLGLSALAIALSVVYLLEDPAWPAYVAVALAVVGAVLLLGSFTGGAAPLVLLGIVLCGALLVGSVVPSSRTGDQYADVATISQLEDRYTHGAGRLTLDLRDVDPDTLLGEEVEIDTGFGETHVLLPTDLPVDVDARVRAGDLRVLDEQRGGLSQRLVERAAGPALTLRIEHTAGLVEVTR